MKKKLFKVVTSVALVGFVFAQTIGGFANGISGQYDTSSKTLTITGTLADSKKEFVTVIVAPQGSLPNTAVDLSNGDVILKTEQVGADGGVDFSITLPSTATYPRYEYIISVEGTTKTAMFSTVTDGNVSSSLGAVNSGSSSDFVNSDPAGLGSGNSADAKSFITSYIDGAKPSGGYTESTLIDAYMIGEGLYKVKSGTLTAETFFEIYSQYLDDDYSAEFDALSAETQSALNTAFRNDVSSEDFVPSSSFAQMFDNNLFVAEYTTADNATDVESILINFYTSNGISLNAYNAIANETYQEKVFDTLYANKANIKTLADIKKAFDDEVVIQKRAIDALNNLLNNNKNNGGGVSGGIGGGGNVSIKPSAPSASAGSEGFSDMNGHWSESYVYELYRRGIVNGFVDGTYGPELSVRRSEMAKMIAVLLKLNVNRTSGFGDVPTGIWYDGYVAALANAGIALGSDGKFFPDDYITKQDAAVMLARVLEYAGKTYSADNTYFNDEGQMASYAKDAINGLAGLGLITGYNGLYNPTSSTSRGEIAALILRVAQYIEQ